MRKIDGKEYMTVGDLRQRLSDKASDALVLIDAGGIRIRGHVAFCPVERVEADAVSLYAGYFTKSFQGYGAVLLL